MSADKYPSIFSRQMAAIVYINLERYKLDQIDASHIRKSLDKATDEKKPTRINIAIFGTHDKKRHAVPANSFN